MTEADPVLLGRGGLVVGKGRRTGTGQGERRTGVCHLPPGGLTARSPRAELAMWVFEKSWFLSLRLCVYVRACVCVRVSPSLGCAFLKKGSPEPAAPEEAALILPVTTRSRNKNRTVPPSG